VMKVYSDIHSSGYRASCHSIISNDKYKLKVKLSRCLIKYRTIKKYGGVEEQFFVFLISAPDEEA
jgi:hypothetical protein